MKKRRVYVPVFVVQVTEGGGVIEVCRECNDAVSGAWKQRQHASKHKGKFYIVRGRVYRRRRHGD